MDAPLAIILHLLPVMVVMLAALEDLRTKRIPNRLTLPAMLAGLLLHFAAGGLPGLWFSFAGLAIGFGLLILFYALGCMGAGDVKLLAAAGAFLGAEGVQSVFIIAAVFSGSVALFRLCGGVRGLARACGQLFHEALGAMLERRPPGLGDFRLQAGTGLCYAPFVAVGVVGALLWRLSGHSYFTLA